MQISQENQRCEMIAHIMERQKGQSTFKWHKNCEIVIPLDKLCSFWIDGEVISAKKGDIVFINSHYAHSFIMDADNTSVGLIIFDVKTILNPSVKFAPIKEHILAEEIDAIEGLRGKLDNLFGYAMGERSAEKIAENPIMQSLISTYYLLLMRYFPAGEKKPPKKQLADFYKIVDYVNDNFREDINIKMIAKQLYMSREKVSSIFYKYSNTRLGEYIDKLRINDVNNMILKGHSITDAAYTSGFSSIRTFNNTYKKIMGYSPSEHLRHNKSPDITPK